MDTVRPNRNHKPFAPNAFNKGQAALTIPVAGAMPVNQVIDIQSSGVPKAIKFPAGWKVAAGTVCFLACFSDADIEVDPPTDPVTYDPIETVMDYVRDSSGALVTMTATPDQLHEVPIEIQRVLGVFNFFAVVSGTDASPVVQDAEVELTVYMGISL